MPTHPPHPALSLLVLRLLVLAVAVGSVFLLFTSAGAADPTPTPTSQYVVDPGDTLWEIASTVAPPGQDLRDVVAHIIELNDLGGGVIQPGQALAVPLEG